MSLDPPIPVVLPLLASAALAGLSRHISRTAASVVAIATAAGTGVVCVLLALAAGGGTAVYWFGGWTPRGQAAIGIGFAMDGIGAGLAALACLLATAALLFSSRYFDTVGTIYHVLMLVFLAAMCGFCLTGDLFNLFVFFELMSVAAFALCGYKSEEAGPLEGALNFAVTNTVGAFLILSGVGLLYGRTGALNMAQIGRALPGAADGLVVAAFAFITAGFLTKAAVAPFHFWLADAHAVAPTPVCVLFSGVMVELGLYAMARVYWTVFSGALGPQTGLRDILVGAGVLTAMLGGIMCYAQRNVKRLLAFSTISHMGVMVMGVGMLAADDLAGAAVYVVGHGLIKGALFMAAGILLHRARSADEVDLHGRGRGMWGTAALFTVGALALAGVPPFSLWRGDAMMARSAQQAGYAWTGWVSQAAAVLTAAAVLRVTGRIFGGWGAHTEAMGAPGSKIPEGPETTASPKTPALMWAPAAGLLALAFLSGIVGELPAAARRVASSFVDRPAYAAKVLDGVQNARAPRQEHKPEPIGWTRGAGGAGAAILLAAVTLFARRVREAFSGFGMVRAPVAGLRRLHSGVVCDYVVWLTLGVAVLGALVAGTTRQNGDGARATGISHVRPATR